MLHDEYFERQRALIEHSLHEERLREQTYQAISAYRHELNCKRAYWKLQHAKRHAIFSECKGRRMQKRVHAAVSKGSGSVITTKRYGYTVICCKSRV